MPESAIDSVVACLRSGWIGTGPVTAEFESQFADYLAVGSAAAVASCTSGLFLSLRALGVGAGDEVITSSMTFCSTVNSILHVGARPVLVDIDPSTNNLDLNAVVDAVGPATKAILPVHYAGFPVDMTALQQVSQTTGCLLIEDCAHAVETLWNGQHAGTFGHAGVFSFYATKNLAIGEGGMVVSQDPGLTDRVARLALHGLSRDAWSRFSVSGKKSYVVEELGYKANMTDLQSAIGLAQLAILEDNYLRRQELWDFYSRALADCDLVLPQTPQDPGARHALHLFAVGLPPHIDRDEFVEAVSNRYGVALGIHYRAIPDFSFYQRELGVRPEEFPRAVEWGRRCVSLSLSPRLENHEAQRVVDALLGSIP